MVVITKSFLIELLQFVFQLNQFSLKIQKESIVKPSELSIDEKAGVGIFESCYFGIAHNVLVH